MFSQEFIAMYKDKQGVIDVQAINNDMFDWPDFCLFRRLLCLCSLIWRYSRPFACDYLQLVSQDGLTLDLDSVIRLLANSQMSRQVMTQTVSMLNNLKVAQPL